MSALPLDDVAKFVRRFVVLNERQADALALWTAHTHAVDATDTTPYLHVYSAEKRSGKSRLLEVLELVVHVPLPTANISDAALFRAIETLAPTLLLDEVDAVFGAKARDREDLRGLLNAGYRRGAVAYRMGGGNNTTLERFAVFCPKVFAGIGALPDTISDRAIQLRLERRTRDERIERFRRREVDPEGKELRDRLADWLEPQLDHLHELQPQLPDELDDRAQDCWEPLLAIAALADGDWPLRAWEAAHALSGNGAREDDSMTARLLQDVYTVFENGAADRFKTSDLIDRLAEIEESPWGDWRGGRRISPQALSKLLRPHRIKTQTVKVDGAPVRGYKREQFEEAFARVLGEVTPSVTPKVTPSKPHSHTGSNAGNAGNAQGSETAEPSYGDPFDAAERAAKFDAEYPPKGRR